MSSYYTEAIEKWQGAFKRYKEVGTTRAWECNKCKRVLISSIEPPNDFLLVSLELDKDSHPLDPYPLQVGWPCHVHESKFFIFMEVDFYPHEKYFPLDCNQILFRSILDR